MQYVGSKSKVAKKMLEAIGELPGVASARQWVEPFLGGANVLAAVHTARPDLFKQAGDLQEDLVLLYQAVASGWRPPMRLDRATWAQLRHAEPSALRGFAGFGASLWGKFFSGYDAEGAPKSARWLMENRAALASTRLLRRDYREWTGDIDEATIVFCDLPYATGTTGYQPGEFDHVAFWEWAPRMAARGATVLVGELTVPDEAPVAQVVWERSYELAGMRRASEWVVERVYLVAGP